MTAAHTATRAACPRTAAASRSALLQCTRRFTRAHDYIAPAACLPAGNPAAAESFCGDLAAGCRQQADGELALLAQMKRRHTQDPCECASNCVHKRAACNLLHVWCALLQSLPGCCPTRALPPAPAAAAATTATRSCGRLPAAGPNACSCCAAALGSRVLQPTAGSVTAGNRRCSSSCSLPAAELCAGRAQ